MNNTEMISIIGLCLVSALGFLIAIAHSGVEAALIIGLSLISFSIAFIAREAFKAITNNSDSAEGVNNYSPVVFGFVEIFSLVLLLIIFQTTFNNGFSVVLGLILHSFSLALLGSSWVENLSKNPNNNFKVPGYIAFSCIELSTILLMKKLFEPATSCSHFILALGIASNVIATCWAGMAFLRAISRNPSAKDQLFYSLLTLVGAIEMTGMCMIGKVFFVFFK